MSWKLNPFPQRSFGLLLALLNLQRKFAFTKAIDGRNVKMPLVSSLVITPHRDLAYQFLHWIRSILDVTPESVPLSALAQVLLRSASTPISDQIAQVHAHRPQILIGTPQAILEALSVDPNPLDIHGISAVVIDEADYLLESLPKKAEKQKDRQNQFSAERNLQRHPSPTRQILDYIYAPVRETPKEENRKKQSSILTGPPFHPRPQLILSSATLRANFRNSVMREGWLTPTYGELVKVGPSSLTLSDAGAVATLGGTAIQHCALVVTDDGSITNISGAIERITTDADTSSSADTTEDESTSVSALLSQVLPLDVESAIESINQEDMTGE